ncbi:hypothetical protein SDJN02_13089, partial [Cucurbita argyrosperma subsp. argyrosperma]
MKRSAVLLKFNHKSATPESLIRHMRALELSFVAGLEQHARKGTVSLAFMWLLSGSKIANAIHLKDANRIDCSSPYCVVQDRVSANGWRGHTLK